MAYRKLDFQIKINYYIENPQFGTSSLNISNKCFL